MMAKETKPLKFSLKLAKRNIIIADEHGKETSYYLKELIGLERDDYMSEMGDKVRYSKKGEFLGMKSFDGLNSSLLCRTLYYTETNETVGETTLQNMPAQVLAEMFEISQAMSGLKKEAEEEAGED